MTFHRRQQRYTLVRRRLSKEKVAGGGRSLPEEKVVGDGGASPAYMGQGSVCVDYTSLIYSGGLGGAEPPGEGGNYILHGSRLLGPNYMCFMYVLYRSKCFGDRSAPCQQTMSGQPAGASPLGNSWDGASRLDPTFDLLGSESDGPSDGQSPRLALPVSPLPMDNDVPEVHSDEDQHMFDEVETVSDSGVWGGSSDEEDGAYDADAESPFSFLGRTKPENQPDPDPTPQQPKRRRRGKQPESIPPCVQQRYSHVAAEVCGLSYKAQQQKRQRRGKQPESIPPCVRQRYSHVAAEICGLSPK